MNLAEKEELGPIRLLKKYMDVAAEGAKDLLQERIIYVASVMIDSGQRCEEVDAGGEIVNFIERMNAKVVSLKDLGFEERINLLGKCFDMLTTKNIRSLIYPFEKQLQLRALCLNNLSVVYKQNNQLQDSLKAVDEAITI